MAHDNLSMQEIELKFQIPTGALGAVRAHVPTGGQAQVGGAMETQILQAAYFDTPDRRLARAHAALRVRRENDDWVQTLKAAGAHAMSRLEDNQSLPPPRPGEAIVPDLARHVGEARTALMRDLAWLPEQDPTGAHTGLVQLYRTDIRRLRAQQAIHDAHGRYLGIVELALDLGDIAAGPLRSAVQELEIELMQGHPLAVIEAARPLVHAHGLWLDGQTKAHRGDQLAREAETGLASPAAPVRRRSKRQAGMDASALRLGALNAALEQAGLNQAEVALGRGEGPAQAELAPWIRAWVLGLRRLRRLGGHATADQANLHKLIRTLRPRPGQLAEPGLAMALARAASTTELSLNLLAQLVAR